MREPIGRNAKNASEIRTLAEKDSLPIHVLELDVTNDASVERCQADPCEDPRGTFLKRRQCSGSRGRRSADYRDSCGREAAEVFCQPPGLRYRPDQRPLKASARQTARSLRPRCRHQIPQR
jgi:hypothetical protein